VGGCPPEGTPRPEPRRRSVHLLPPAGCAAAEHPEPVQDRADARNHDLSARVVRGNTFRQIFTDGRPLPKLSETEPAWLGYSVGHWEGDDFVVESIGFRDRGWLSANMAYPNSDALKVTERFHRVDFGHLEDTVTIDDPKAYKKPWTNKIPLVLQADTELLDSYCDNQGIMQSHYSMGPRPEEPHSPPLPGEK